MSKIMLASIVAMLIGMPLTAYSASRLSEKEACRMASAKVPALIASNPRGGANVRALRCTDFMSISDRGVAQITVMTTWDSPTFHNTAADWPINFSFIRTDQGWKIDRYGDAMGSGK